MGGGEPACLKEAPCLVSELVYGGAVLGRAVFACPRRRPYSAAKGDRNKSGGAPSRVHSPHILLLWGCGLAMPRGLPFSSVVGLGAACLGGGSGTVALGQEPLCLVVHLPAAELSLPLPGL